jgi:tetraacyldisaccharide 4'-kinase
VAARATPRAEPSAVTDARGPLPAWLAPLSWPLARAYGLGVGWRNARFSRGEGVRALEVEGARIPVVSVGNMSAGGTGKTPFVAWCAREAIRTGVHPAIALRGYRSADHGRGVASSDEAMEYAQRVPEADLVVGPKRHEGLVAWFSSGAGASRRAESAVFLDDGFQHRQLARELDIVLVDATRPALDGDLLPNGWLREPAANIARAGLVVLTKADDPRERERAARLVERWRGAPHDAVCVHAWQALELHGGKDAQETLATSWLAGKRVVSACALGNPAHFHAMVERAGAQVAARLEKGDHRAFTRDELARAAARAGAECVVTSRKDFVKLDDARECGVPIAVPELALEFVEGEDAVRARIRAAISGG